MALHLSGSISLTGSLTAGTSHTNTGTLSSIVGGTFNTASAACSFIGGGISNSISSNYSQNAKHVIVGGNNNSISGDYQSHTSVIVGGQDNTLSGAYNNFRFIGAGCNNTISNSLNRGVIVGGVSNTIDGPYGGPGAFIGAGELNTANSPGGIIVGGCCNSAQGSNSGIFIGGGLKNKASQGYSLIVGGTLNTASGACSGILGGECNYACETESFIIGSNLTSDKACYTFMNNIDVEGTVSASIFSGSFVGDASGLTGISGGGGGGDYSPFITGSIYNTSILPREGDNKIIVGQNATVAGGTLNTGSGQCTFIGGGELNYASTSHGAVVGGCKNHALSPQSAVVGGHDNHACANQAFIGAGRCNIVAGYTGGIVSGDSNCISSAVNYSFIGGGTLNTASAHCSAILGGDRNYISASLNNSFIIGSDITADKACYTFMNNLDVQGEINAQTIIGSFSGSFEGAGFVSSSAVSPISTQVTEIVTLNQTTYDGLTPSSNVLYVIV